MTMVRYLDHHRVRLALHELQGGAGRPLLLLHGLGERAPLVVPVGVVWPGPIVGLDFTGHGESSVPAGGGYSCEVLMADVDAVLAALGPCTLLGRGLGAYVALLTAGARPTLVRGSALCPGPGLTGGPVGPISASIVARTEERSTTPDPWALAELSRDVRPGDYARAFARHAVENSGMNEPIAVCMPWQPDWARAVLEEPGTFEASVAEALAAFSVANDGPA